MSPGRGIGSGVTCDAGLGQNIIPCRIICTLGSMASIIPRGILGRPGYRGERYRAWPNSAIQVAEGPSFFTKYRQVRGWWRYCACNSCQTASPGALPTILSGPAICNCCIPKPALPRIGAVSRYELTSQCPVVTRDAQRFVVRFCASRLASTSSRANSGEKRAFSAFANSACVDNANIASGIICIWQGSTSSQFQLLLILIHNPK